MGCVVHAVGLAVLIDLNSKEDTSENYCFKYLPAILSANEGSIKKTVANKSFISISLIFESGVSGPEAVMTIKIPIIPKKIDE